MASLHFNTFCVDQLVLVVSTIPIGIFPEFFNVLSRKRLDMDIVINGLGQDRNIHFLEWDCPKITYRENKIKNVNVLHFFYVT
jgi:hypothetical protein